MNSTVLNQFNIHQDQQSSCNCSHYSPLKLALPTPATHLSSSSTNNIPITTARKAKVNICT